MELTNKKILAVLHENLLYTQKDMFKVLLNRYKSYLAGYYDNKFMLLKSDNKLKPLLCVHLDTINDTMECIPSIGDFIFTHKTGLLTLNKNSTLNCLGGDDRCGVTIITLAFKELIEKYHIAFFCDEEVGGLGSSASASAITSDNSISCYIGLDRKGTTEVATYGFDNQALIDLFVDNGYVETQGSFTDASNLARESNKACINLSVGYGNEHSRHEFIDLRGIDNAIDILLYVTFDGVYKQEIAYNNYSDDGYVYSDEEDFYGDIFKDEKTKSTEEELYSCDYCGIRLTSYFDTDWSVFICEKCRNKLAY